VDDDAALGGDGMSWDSAFRFLQDALAAAAAGDVIEIHVAAGVYTPDRDEGGLVTPLDRSASFEMRSGLAILGGYCGISGDGDPDHRDPDVYVSILSGDLANNDVGTTGLSDNSWHVVTAVGVDASSALSGFTVTGGNAADDFFFPMGAGMVVNGGAPTVIECEFHGHVATYGGALYIVASNATYAACGFHRNTADTGGAIGIGQATPTFVKCHIHDNRARSDGGGIGKIGDFADPTLIDCTFSRNTAGDSGGAMYNDDNAPVLRRCVFEANSAQSGGAVFNNTSEGTAQFVDCSFLRNTADSGGAIYNSFTALALAGCLFDGNSAGYGGAVFDHYSLNALDRCTFVRNQAVRGGGLYRELGEEPAKSNRIVDSLFIDNHAGLFGGAICGEDNSGVTIQDCVFRGNSAGDDDGGGGAVATMMGGDLLIQRCEFRENSAGEGQGAAVWSFNTDHVTLENSLFYGNEAPGGVGGAATLAFATCRVTNCTFHDNRSGAFGGAIDLYAECDATLVNNILWGDAAPNGSELAVRNRSTAHVSYCDVRTIGTDVFVDAMSTLNWGPGNISVDPAFVAPLVGDLHLTPTSPCIDAGSNMVVSLGATDLDGHPRRVDALGVPDTGDPGVLGPPIVDMGAYEFRLVGDMDGDGDVDLDDYAQWADCLAGPEVMTPPVGCTEVQFDLADEDEDGDVDLADFGLFVVQFGR
jgi:predicted outer membrane repeat protein